MSERHKYEYTIDLDADHVGTRILRMVGRGRQLLELGAGPGSITRLLQEHGQCRVTAIEYDATAIEKLRPYCERVHQCDLNAPDWPAVLHGARFQTIVAADVLEHLTDPWTTLRRMRDLLTEDGEVVVSLPHVGHQALLAALADGKFGYREWGLLDHTHVRFFGVRDMQRLFEQAGFSIVDAEFLVRAPEHTEFARDWAQTPEPLRRALSQTPFGRVYQVVIKALPRAAARGCIQLDTLPVPALGPLLPKGASLSARGRLALKLLARRYLSQRFRARISDWLVRHGVRL